MLHLYGIVARLGSKNLQSQKITLSQLLFLNSAYLNYYTVSPFNLPLSTKTKGRHA